MTYEEGLEIRKKWWLGAAAEYAGFMDAFEGVKRNIAFQGPYETQRYDQGFSDGSAMLELTKQVPA